MSKGPESAIVRRIIARLQVAYPGAYLRKIHGNQFQHAGIPDILGCIEGRFIALEVKTTSGRRSRIQELEADEIIRNNGIYGVVTDEDEALQVIAAGLFQLKASRTRRVT